MQVTAAQNEARGFTNALEALNDIPLTGTGASFNGNNGGRAASLGQSFADLLDLGTQRTLTLLSGRRFVSGNAASLFVFGNETGSQVDVNAIPSTLISRIDVVTVGGAAVYGSDAIAGVINFILKDDYQGVEAHALTGLSDQHGTGLTVAANGAAPTGLSGNGLNGRTAAMATLPITTFAPTALPAGVTAAAGVRAVRRHAAGGRHHRADGIGGHVRARQVGGANVGPL